MTLAEAMGYYYNHPVEFVVDIIGANPEPYQAEILEAVRDNGKVSVRSGHGTGKTALLAWTIIWYLITRPYARIPCTAPTQHQLQDILWAEIAKWLNHSGLNDALVWSSETVHMKGYKPTWFAVARTARDPNALQGFHGKNLLFVIDEASGVNDALYQPIMGALTEENAKLIMCGNPTMLSGFFYDSHHGTAEKYATFKLDGSKSARVNPTFVQDIIDMFGRDSDAYRVRVAGEFPSAMPDSFISLEWVEKCLAKVLLIEEVKTVDIGVDVARFGDDETVIQPVINKHIVQRSEKLLKNDIMQVTGAVMQMAKNLHNRNNVRITVKVDCDGLGVGVYDRIKEIKQAQSYGWLNPVECHFGGKGGRLRTSDPIEFANSTGLMWGNLRAKLKAGELVMMKDDKLIGQITNRKYKLDSEGRILLERKEEMKKRGAHSPDRADALALALYEKPETSRLSVVSW